jgi:uncharacterized LabA/DUF88 family protein
LAAFFPPSTRDTTRVMMFIDGENLAKRYAAVRGSERHREHVVFAKDVYVWSRLANRDRFPQVIRRYYYTSAPGDERARAEIEDRLRAAGIQAPRVFYRPKSGRSKQVDITLATDMLSHAHRNNYDIAVLVAGDADYVPLVEAVKREGQQVALWFVNDGLSPVLRAAADHYWDIGELLLLDRQDDFGFIERFY